jgi:hypothetical protein
MRVVLVIWEMRVRSSVRCDPRCGIASLIAKHGGVSSHTKELLEA